MALQAHNQQLFKVTIATESATGASANGETSAGNPVTGVFASAFEGAGWQRATEKYGDPEKSVMRTLVGFRELSEVTFTTLYTPDKAPIVELLDKDAKSPGRYTIVMTPIKDTIDGEPIGQVITMTGCVLTDCKYPTLNRDQVGKSVIVIKAHPDEIQTGSSNGTAVQNQ